MQALVRQAMEEGALGVGSSLIYAPAFYADTEELCEEATITHIVYVDGVQCWADESRVGGIVVQPRPDTPG